MVAQCASVVAAILFLSYESAPDWLQWTTFVSLWISVILTVVSAMEYVLVVIRGDRNSESRANAIANPSTDAT
jgi:uncharacterized protein involved in cysteine biosynthesis